MRHAHWIGLLLVLATALPAAGQVRLIEDEPMRVGGKTGQVRGRIRHDGEIANLRAVSRVTGASYQPQSFEPGTGRFVFARLPADARYDVCFQVGLGRQIEGIDLDFVDQRLNELAQERRKQLGLAPQRTHPFSPRDAQGLLDYVENMEEFMEQRRVLYVRGHGMRATLLVELMRTRAFYAAKGQECIWRVELWYFRNEFGGWDKLPNQERVLRRERLAREQWQTMHVEYYPDLSVYVSPQGQAEAVAFEVPRAPDASRGRTPRTKPDLKTAPHISGLDVKPQSTSAPSTQPAQGNPAPPPPEHTSRETRTQAAIPRGPSAL